MRAWHRRLAVASFIVGATCASCSLLNSLDYLESRDNGASVADSAASASAESGVLPDDAPGCPPSRWASCGVRVVASDVKTSALAADATDTVFYGDDERGTILRAACTHGVCTDPVVVKTGEETVLALAYRQVLSLTWGTASAVRATDDYDDASAPRIIAPAHNARALATSADGVTLAWIDDDGVHYQDFTGIRMPFRGAASAPVVNTSNDLELRFVGGGSIQQCSFDSFGQNPCTQTTPVPGTEGAIGLTFARGFGNYAVAVISNGYVAALAGDAGTTFVLAEEPDDAGVLPIIGTTTEPLAALAGSESDVYFTTTPGELYRISKGVAPTLLLRGLGRTTHLAVSSTVVFVANPEARQLLQVPR